MSACAFESRRIAASHGMNVHPVHPRRNTLKVVDHLYKAAIRDLIFVELDGTRDLFARNLSRRLLDDILIDGDSARGRSLRGSRATTATTSLLATTTPAACRRRGWLRLRRNERSRCTERDRNGDRFCFSHTSPHSH